jgi:predicted glutamine amidotransferase
MSKNKKLYDIHNLIQQGKYQLAEDKLILEYDDLIEKARSYYSLLIKTKIKLNKIDEAYKLLIGENIMKKIDYLNFIEVSKNKDKVYKVFSKCIKCYRLTSKEIDFIIDKKLYFILTKLDGYHVTTSHNGNFSDFKKLKLYKFGFNSYNLIIDKFIDSIKNKKYIDKLKKKIASNDFKIIIDFGNIIHRFSNTDKFDENFKKYEYVFSFFENIKKEYGEPMIISSKKHFKKVKDDKTNEIIDNIKKNYKNNIFYSAYGEDDDNFIILASLITNKKIITRDKFKNHLLKFNETEKLYDFFKIYIRQMTFDHYIISKKKKKSFIKNSCIQVFDDHILIPTEKKDYLRIEIEKINENQCSNIYYYLITIIILIISIIYLIFTQNKYIMNYLNFFDLVLFPLFN